jgi:single-strand DNA-binding protein
VFSPHSQAAVCMLSFFPFFLLQAIFFNTHTSINHSLKITVMQTIIGRLTADAEVKQLDNGKQVMNYTVAKNSRYKPKGSDEVKQKVTYFNCASWGGFGVAPYLKKGTLVEVSGDIDAKGYTDKDGKVKAKLVMNVQKIDLHAKPTATTTNQTAPANQAADGSDDLPF